MTENEAALVDVSVTNGRLPRIGLALSGGGARGIAHIGVLKVLEREGIPVHYLAGTSMGGVIAAACATGMSPEEIENEALATTHWRSLASLADLSLPQQGLFKGERLLAYFERQFGQRTFADLDLPLALVAVDLNSGQEIILQDGLVALAVRATVALPGILAPVEMNGMRLADGGLLNNLPADVAHQMGAEVVIAVDVFARNAEVWTSHIRWAPKGVTGILQVIGESVEIMRSAINAQKLAQTPSEILICPDIPPDVSAFAGFGRAAELIGAGERAAEAALPRIRAQMDACQHRPERSYATEEIGSQGGPRTARPASRQF